MNIHRFESLILSELKYVTESILTKNAMPNISAKARAGAEISDLLEKQFVIETQNHTYFKKSQYSPEGATKNPWDAMTYFCIKGHEELVWIDFKAVKVSSADSNPDIGTPDKIINLINQGYFYLAMNGCLLGRFIVNYLRYVISRNLSIFILHLSQRWKVTVNVN